MVGPRSDGLNAWAFGNWSLIVKASWTYFSLPLPSMTRYGSLSYRRNGAIASSRSSIERFIRSWLWSVIWLLISMSKSRKRRANRRRFRVVSSLIPVVPVQRFVTTSLSLLPRG